MTVLLVDNYDSFTFNLFQCLGGLGAVTHVHLNDRLTLDDVRALAPTHIVLSPGPGRPDGPHGPEDFGICRAIIETFVTTPILGVCLGHQGIVDAMGGRVIRAPAVMHGKISHITHDGRGIFLNLPSPLAVMRYHSLIAETATLPDLLIPTAHTEDGLVMAVRHQHRPLVGVQFHPESIGTPDGPALLDNFLAIRP